MAHIDRNEQGEGWKKERKLKAEREGWSSPKKKKKSSYEDKALTSHLRAGKKTKTQKEREKTRGKKGTVVEIKWDKMKIAWDTMQKKHLSNQSCFHVMQDTFTWAAT